MSIIRLVIELPSGETAVTRHANVTVDDLGFDRMETVESNNDLIKATFRCYRNVKTTVSRVLWNSTVTEERVFLAHFIETNHCEQSAKYDADTYAAIDLASKCDEKATGKKRYNVFRRDEFGDTCFEHIEHAESYDDAARFAAVLMYDSDHSEESRLYLCVNDGCTALHYSVTRTKVDDFCVPMSPFAYQIQADDRPVWKWKKDVWYYDGDLVKYDNVIYRCMHWAANMTSPDTFQLWGYDVWQKQAPTKLDQLETELQDHWKNTV